MSINAPRFILGSLLAGLVGNVIGFVGFGLLLGPRMQAEAAAVVPALHEHGMGGSAVAVNIAAQFVTGFLVVWLYAAMLPSFGTGLKTAGYAALVVGLCHVMFHVDWLLFGMLSPKLYALAEGLALLQLLLAAWGGSLLYRENRPASEARPGLKHGL